MRELEASCQIRNALSELQSSYCCQREQSARPLGGERTGCLPCQEARATGSPSALKWPAVCLVFLSQQFLETKGGRYPAPGSGWRRFGGRCAGCCVCA